MDIENCTQYLSENIYPIIKSERQVDISPEVMAVKGEAYYFASDFKKKNFIIDELLEKYRRNKTITIFNKTKGLHIRNRRTKGYDFVPFSKKKEEILEAIDAITFKTGSHSVPIYDVLAYLEISKGCFLLTSNEIYSPNMLEDYERHVALFKIDRIDDTGIFGIDGTCYCMEKFPVDFINLLDELIILNRNIEYLDVQHPMFFEVSNIREQYINFLVLRLCMEDIRACDIIRLEIISRQLKISSRYLIGAIKQIYKAGKASKAKKVAFINEKINTIEINLSDYNKIIFCDLAAFDLYGNEGSKLSDFTKKLADKMGIQPKFRENYMRCLKELQNANKDIKEVLEGQDEVVCKMIKFEKEIHENINRRKRQ